jgi:HlyD family secretion protein
MARLNVLAPLAADTPVLLPEPSLRLNVFAGFAVIVMFFGTFAGWSMFADLDSAVVAKGTIVVDSHRKTLQHLEGGILRKLHVREGDVVKANCLPSSIARRPRLRWGRP